MPSSTTISETEETLSWCQDMTARTPQQINLFADGTIDSQLMLARDLYLVVPKLLNESSGVAHFRFGKSFRSRCVASSRSIALAATAKVNSSHSGPSALDSIPFKRRKTRHAPSAARLLPSMNG